MLVMTAAIAPQSTGDSLDYWLLAEKREANVYFESLPDKTEVTI